MIHWQIMWLPPNATSEYQPLDQGIINTWKTATKKQLVLFMAETYDKGRNISQEMHVLRSIRWGIHAWEYDVTPSTIQSCWRRSQAIDYGAFPLFQRSVPQSVWTECEAEIDSIRRGLIRMKAQGYIQSIPNLHDYISPYSGPWSERVDDHGDLEDLVDEIVATHIQQDVDEEEEEGQLIQEPLPLVSHSEALTALHTLRRYEEEYKWSDGAFLRALRSFERDLGERYHDSLEQVTLDRYFILRSQGSQGSQGSQ
jgi:DDE superfamily endonuclease